jgi:hypothetical protein
MFPFATPLQAAVASTSGILVRGQRGPCAASYLAKSIRVLKDSETDLLRAIHDDTIVKRRDQMGTGVAWHLKVRN